MLAINVHRSALSLLKEPMILSNYQDKVITTVKCFAFKCVLYFFYGKGRYNINIQRRRIHMRCNLLKYYEI